MDETKWTPGPWRVSYYPQRVEADLPPGEPEYSIARTYADRHAKANACLISAAPELYACAAFLAELSEDGFDHDGKTAILMARDACDKARGKTSP